MALNMVLTRNKFIVKSYVCVCVCVYVFMHMPMESREGAGLLGAEVTRLLQATRCRW